MNMSADGEHRLPALDHGQDRLAAEMVAVSLVHVSLRW